VRRTAGETRDHVLHVARELFYWDGVRATGIDRVASEADVAATTLYRLFGSKDDLVAAYVEREFEGYRAWFGGAEAGGGDDPRARILAVFAALTEQVRPENCRGCPFLLALGEFPDPAFPAHRHAAAAKTWTRTAFHRLAVDLPAADPDTLADALCLLVEGTYASVQALGADGPAARAERVARTLVDAAV